MNVRIMPLLVVASLLLFASIILIGRSAETAVPGGTGLAKSTRDLLPIGSLKPAPSGAAEQKRVLSAIARALDAVQEGAEFDAHFLTVERKSETFFEIVTRDAARAKVSLSLDRQRFLGPTWERVRWAVNGPKMRHETQIVRALREEPKPDDYHIYAYDGQFNYLYNPGRRNGSVEVAKGRDGIPEFARFVAQWTLSAYDRGRPLSAMLKNPETRYDGRQSVGGVECLKVTIPRKNGGRTEIWFSPANGYCAMRITDTEPGWMNVGELEATIECESFRQVDGGWFPEEGKFVRLVRTEEGREQWLATLEWKLTSFKAEAPDCLFTLDFPLGTTVSDMTGEGAKWRIVGGEPRERATPGKSKK